MKEYLLMQLFLSSMCFFSYWKPVLWTRIRIKLEGGIRIRIKVISWVRIRIHIKVISWTGSASICSWKAKWNMSLFEYFFKVLSLEARIRMRIRIRIRIKVMRIRNTTENNILFDKPLRNTLFPSSFCGKFSLLLTIWTEREHPNYGTVWSKEEKFSGFLYRGPS